MFFPSNATSATKEIDLLTRKQDEKDVEGLVRSLLWSQAEKNEHEVKLQSCQRELESLKMKDAHFQEKAKELAHEEGKIRSERADYQMDLDKLNADKKNLENRKQSMKTSRENDLTEKVLGRWQWHQTHEESAVKCVDQQHNGEQAKLRHEKGVIQQRQEEVAQRVETSGTKASKKVGQPKFMNKILNEEQAHYRVCKDHTERSVAS